MPRASSYRPYRTSTTAASARSECRTDSQLPSRPAVRADIDAAVVTRQRPGRRLRNVGRRPPASRAAARARAPWRAAPGYFLHAAGAPRARERAPGSAARAERPRGARGRAARMGSHGGWSLFLPPSENGRWTGGRLWGSPVGSPTCSGGEGRLFIARARLGHDRALLVGVEMEVSGPDEDERERAADERKSTRLNSS